MVSVKILESHGLSLHTSSPQSAAKQLEDCLNALSQELGSLPVAVVTRSIGRSTYHLAVFPVSEERTQAKVSEASEAPTPKRAKRSKPEAEAA